MAAQTGCGRDYGSGGGVGLDNVCHPAAAQDKEGKTSPRINLRKTTRAPAKPVLVAAMKSDAAAKSRALISKMPMFCSVHKRTVRDGRTEPNWAPRSIRARSWLENGAQGQTLC